MVGDRGGSRSAARQADSLESTMRQLQLEAESTARRKVYKKFSTPHELETLDAFRDTCVHDLEILKMQLTSVVQAKLDGVKSATDFIAEGQSRLTNLRQEFGELRRLCADTSDLLGALPRVKAVSVAQRNLLGTIEQVEFFTLIPLRVERLKKLLEEQPTHLPAIYKESQQLEIWRDELLREVRHMRRQTAKEIGAVATIKKRATTSATYTEADCDKIMQALAGHFAQVLELSATIRKTILGRMAAFWELFASDQRGVLNATIEAIELHMKYKSMRLARAGRLAESEEREDAEVLQEILKSEDLRADAAQQVEKAVETRLVTCFAKRHMEIVDEGENNLVTATLDAANVMLQDLLVGVREILPLFSSEFELKGVFKQKCDNFLRLKLQSFYQDPTIFQSLSPKDVLSLIEWLEYYEAFLLKLDLGLPSQDIRDGAGPLMQRFLDHVRGHVMRWFENISKRELEYVNDAEGRPISAQPEDTLNIINLQVKLAKARLSGIYISQVIRECIMILDEVRQSELALLGQKYREMDPMALSCKVNDYQRMQNLLETFFENVSDDLTDVDRDAMELFIEETTTGYVLGAQQILDLIVSQIYGELDAAEVYSGIFREAWQQGDDGCVDTIFATLEDYFENVIKITPYSFNQAVLKCLDRFLIVYVEKFLEKRRKASFQDVQAAANQMRADLRDAVDFFKKYESSLMDAGLRGGAEAIPLYLKVIGDFADLLDTEVPMIPPPSSASASASAGRPGSEVFELSMEFRATYEKVLRAFQSQGPGVVMHVLDMRNLSYDRNTMAYIEEEVQKSSEPFIRQQQSKFSLPHIQEGVSEVKHPDKKTPRIKKSFGTRPSLNVREFDVFRRGERKEKEG